VFLSTTPERKKNGSGGFVQERETVVCRGKCLPEEKSAKGGEEGEKVNDQNRLPGGGAVTGQLGGRELNSSIFAAYREKWESQEKGGNLVCHY